MKEAFFLIVFSLIFSYSSFSQIRMDSQGQVRFGSYPGDPRYNFDVDAHAYFSCRPDALSGFYFEDYNYNPIILPQNNHALYLGNYDRELWRIYTEYIRVAGVWLSSDEKIKENIRPLSGSLNKLLLLEAVKFDYKAELYNDSLDLKKDELIAKRKDHAGFIAQEVQTIYPKLVEFNEDADLLEINYLGFIPEVIAALKEQQLIIESLQTEILELKSESDTKKSGNSSLETGTTNTLYQNYPNPFTQSSVIEYFLTDDIQEAMICIYDMNGTQLKSISLHLKGYGDVTINGGEFHAGMYTYSLIADGQLIDIKQMILTD